MSSPRTDVERAFRLTSSSMTARGRTEGVLFRADRGQFYYLIITKRKVNEIKEKTTIEAPIINFELWHISDLCVFGLFVSLQFQLVMRSIGTPDFDGAYPVKSLGFK